MSQNRYVSLDIPAGWSATRWADYCYHMHDVSAGVRPDLSDQWFHACVNADRIAGSVIQRKKAGRRDSPGPTEGTQTTNDCEQPAAEAGGLEAILLG
jgi:hypothetical protein